MASLSKKNTFFKKKYLLSQKRSQSDCCYIKYVSTNIKSALIIEFKPRNTLKYEHISLTEALRLKISHPCTEFVRCSSQCARLTAEKKQHPQNNKNLFFILTLFKGRYFIILSRFTNVTTVHAITSNMPQTKENANVPQIITFCSWLASLEFVKHVTVRYY